MNKKHFAIRRINYTFAPSFKQSEIGIDSARSEVHNHEPNWEMWHKINMKVVNFTTPTQKQPQSLLVIDEAMLRTLLQEEIKIALRSMKNEKPQPYTRNEAMQVLHIKETALWVLQQNGTLHPFRVGGRVLFNREEVDAVAQGKKGGRYV